MRSFGRAVAWFIPIAADSHRAAVAAVFTGTSQGEAVSDPVVISNLRADFSVDRDGLMRPPRPSTTEFPRGRHGIFRFWDTANPNDSHVRQVPEVTDGLPRRQAGALRTASAGR